uniref:Gustatory receptor n=1 Tax=Stomoxys calcitrans TaxID=35570 RepID=A0A905ST53_STOCA
MKSQLEKVLEWCKEIGKFVAIFFGFTSHWYDYEKKIFKRNAFSRLAMIAVNIIGLALMFRGDSRFLSAFSRTDLNPAMKIVPCSRFLLITLPPVCTFGQIIFCDRQLTNIKKRLQFLEMESLTKIRRCSEIEGTLRRLKFFKYFLIIFMYLMTTYGESESFKELSALAIFYVNIISLSNLWMLQYFLVIARACRLFRYYDFQIRQMVKEFEKSLHDVNQNMEDHACAQLYWLRCQHSQLSGILKELQSFFGWQLLLKRVISLINNGMLIYSTIFETIQYEFMYVFTHDIPDYVSVILDFFVTDYVSELTKNTFNDLQLSLNELTEFSYSLKKLNRECEEFALYLHCLKLNLQQSTHLNMDRQNWFAMMSAAVTITIVFTQAHLGQSV